MPRRHQLLALLWASCCFATAVVDACNRKHAADFVQVHFGREPERECLSRGQQCTFDRNCCAGLECRMGAAGGGVESRCASRRVYEDYREQTSGQQWQDYQSVERWRSSRGLAELERRNGRLRRRLAELAGLRAERRARDRAAALADLRRRRLEALTAERAAAEREERDEVEALRRRDWQRRLLDEERKQVNVSLAGAGGRSRGDLGLYMNMLSDTRAGNALDTNQRLL